MKRQAGAEMVEFILTLPFFFIVVFMFIDFGIVLFDKGTLNEASRIGARQASLFWIDPANYNNDPKNATEIRRNIRMKESMIVTAVDLYRDNILIKFASDTGTISPKDTYFVGMPSGDVTGSYPARTFIDVSGYALTINLCYPYRDFGLLSLLNINNATGCPTDANPTPPAPAPRQLILDARSRLTAESRL